MAEFLFILADKYDYPQLTEAVLKDLSTKEFNPNDLKGPKSVSTFLIKVSEYTPHIISKELMVLATMLQSEVQTTSYG